MNKWERDIHDLMTAFGQTSRETPDSPPVSQYEMELRKALVREEAQELIDAIDDGHLPSIAKEICDVLVVTIGVARSYGLELGPLWNAVHKSNMAKVGGPVDPKTGKHLKPKGWKKPDMEKLVRKQGWLQQD